MTKNFFKNNCAGFSLIEIIVSLAIFSIILLFVVSFFFTMSSTNFKTKSDRTNLETVRRVLDEMAFEIKSAKSIYTPTTTSHQLSLETARYLSQYETNTYIDFFLCGYAICLKKEFQDPIVLTTDQVRITSMTFLRILNGSTPSIRINLTLSHASNVGSGDISSSDISYTVDLTTTAALRSGSVMVEEDYLMGWVEAQPDGNINKNWTTIACSADGAKVVAIANTSDIYTSTNSGASWTTQTSPIFAYIPWTSIASSADGVKLAAINSGGYIYTSINSGATWTMQTSFGPAQWMSIASDSTGAKLAVVLSGRNIYTSINSGANWTEQTNSGARNWRSIASSHDPATSDGVKLAAIDSGGYIYTSTNSGASWTTQTGSGLRNWTSIASSSNGAKLAAVVNGGYIYTSTNSGASWTTQNESSGLHWWSTIASSSNGAKLIAGVAGGRLYISSDSGATWAEHQPAGDSDKDWSAVAINADGSKFFATVMGGRMYVGSFSP